MRFPTKADASDNNFKEMILLTSPCHAIVLLLIPEKAL